LLTFVVDFLASPVRGLEEFIEGLSSSNSVDVRAPCRGAGRR
jgi:hypothetical protein